MGGLGKGWVGEGVGWWVEEGKRGCQEFPGDADVETLSVICSQSVYFR